MAQNSFSQKKLENTVYKCDGCAAGCELSYEYSDVCIWPKIGDQVIRDYRDNEFKGILSKHAGCKTEFKAIELARHIATFCDHYSR